MKTESKDDFERIAGILHVLGHPDRLRILACLIREKCFVNDIALRLDLPQSTVSQHLRLMADRGILTGERDGVRVCYIPVDPIAIDIAKLLLPSCEDK